MTSSSNAIVRSSGDIAESNRIHEECLAMVKAAIKGGANYTVMPIVDGPLKPGTINRKSPRKSNDKFKLKGLSAIDRFKIIITHFGSLTRNELVKHTGMKRETISRTATILSAAGFITRSVGKAGNSQVTFSVVASA